MKCRICSSNSTKLLFISQNVHGRKVLSDEEFEVRQCRDCGIVFTALIIEEKYYHKYYPKDYYPEEQSNFAIKKILYFLQRISFRQKLKLITRHKPQGNKILEVGCAKGEFLNALPAYFEKYGNEINDKACRYIEDNYKGITIYNNRIDNIFFDEKEYCKYDSIVAWHVFEHIENPSIFLENISKIIAEDGVLIIEVPNQNSLGFRLTRNNWFHLDTPRHLFHYSYQSLNRLLEKYSFKIVGYKANPVDYCQDLISSLYMKFKTNNCFLNSIMLVVIVPFAFIVRLVTALFLPAVSEINTYIIKHI